MQKALILVNIGSPDKPEKQYVKRFLKEFLNDRHVINLPWLARKILVNCIIIPFRTPKSTALYKQLWTERGSPLLFYMQGLEKKTKAFLSTDYQIYTAYRYGSLSLKKSLQHIKNQNFDEVIIFPMFPQYASSTTGSIIDVVNKEIKTWIIKPYLKIIPQFYHHPAFIDSWVKNIKQFDYQSYEKIVFSYHSLPLSHIRNLHSSVKENTCTCFSEMPQYGSHCYKATCYQTTRLLADSLQLPKNKYITTFQSQISENWLSPFTDTTILALAQNKIKKILVITPSFTTDCLETIYEIGKEYKEMFLRNGGEELTLVPCLNDSDSWVKAIAEIIK